MRNFKQITVFVIAIFTLCKTARAQFSGQNIITNAGFETDVQPWLLDNWPHNEVSAERDNQNPHSGQWSMKVQLTKELHIPNLMFAYPHLPITPGAAFQIKFWARGVSNGANLTLMLRSDVEPRNSYLRTEMNLTDDWHEYTYVVQLPQNCNADATSLRFVLNQIGVFWIDDVSVIKLPPMETRLLKVASGFTKTASASSSNAIRNPSFEVGTDGWTATIRKREFGNLEQESGNTVPAPDDAKLETQIQNAPEGQRYLTFKIDRGCRASLTSAYFPARYGHSARLSFYLKADSAGSFEAGIGSGANASTSYQTKTLQASFGWQKYTVPFTLKPTQGGMYYVVIKINRGGNYAVDGVSFVEDGQPATNLYPQSVAIQATPNTPLGNLYGPKDIAAFKLVTADGKPGTTINYDVTIVDYLEKKIASIPVSLVLNQRGYAEKVFNVPVKAFGAFRIEAREQGQNELQAEQIYSVLQPLPQPSERPDSYFGGHVDFSPYNLEIARKGGFRWLRMWPPLASTWIAAEPRPGVWNFQTEDIKRASAMGFQISGVLGTTPDFKIDDPANLRSVISNRWSHSYAPKNTDDWKQYVAKAINAFYPYVKTWEVWNEPDGGYLQVPPGAKKSDIYVNLLKAARQTIDSVRKPVTLMGPALGDINSPLGTDILQQGGGNYIDAYSFHFYNLTASGSNPNDAFLQQVLTRIRGFKNVKGLTMPLWHTEGGMYLQGAQSWLNSYNIPATSPDKKPIAAASMVRAALFFKAVGVKHYFDFQLDATAAGREVNIDQTTGFIEVTGIPGPALAAHTAMVAITEDAEPVGFDDTPLRNAHIKVAHFKTAATHVDVYWSDKPVQFKEVVNKSYVKVLDMMGNQVDAATATINEYPLYVIAAN